MAIFSSTRAIRPLVVSVELAAGALLLGGAALGAVFFVHRPRPNRLDVEGFALLASDPKSHIDHLVASLGSLRDLLVATAALALIAVFRDRARALACIVGPIAAVLVTERIGKPLVGRHLYAFGAYSYPSGTVTAVAALATALVLVSPRFVRPLALVVGVVVVAAVSAAVVAMRWHFPTDALGGALVGAGATLLFDGLFHGGAYLRSGRRARRQEPLDALGTWAVSGPEERRQARLGAPQAAALLQARE